MSGFIDVQHGFMLQGRFQYAAAVFVWALCSRAGDHRLVDVTRDSHRRESEDRARFLGSWPPLRPMQEANDVYNKVAHLIHDDVRER
jgi:hypothetical protein